MRGHEQMMSVKLKGFWDPLPPLIIFDWSIILKSRNLPYYKRQIEATISPSQSRCHLYMAPKTKCLMRVGLQTNNPHATNLPFMVKLHCYMDLYAPCRRRATYPYEGYPNLGFHCRTTGRLKLQNLGNLMKYPIHQISSTNSMMCANFAASAGVWLPKSSSNKIVPEQPRSLRQAK